MEAVGLWAREPLPVPLHAQLAGAGATDIHKALGSRAIP
jgi:hypothetical protein